jgi:NADH dehydrogenase FAD-containing subunit
MTAGVLVVGGGVAALETAAALRALAGSRVDITLVAPTARFEPRALSVTAPFEERRHVSVSISDVARRAPFELRLGVLERVRVRLRRALSAGGHDARGHGEERYRRCRHRGSNVPDLCRSVAAA